MLITVFRSRLKPGVREDYVALVERMNELAKTMPGYISHKGFFADDGERVTIVEFAHEEGLRAWRTNPEHITAQNWRGRNITPSITFRSARWTASPASRPMPRNSRRKLDPAPGSRHLAARPFVRPRIDPRNELWKSSRFSKVSPRR